MKHSLRSAVLPALLVTLMGVSAWEYQVRKSTAEATQVQGLYIFHRARPVMEYTSLGTVEVGGMVMSARYEASEEALVKKAKKKFPTADGLLMAENGFSAEVVKFN